MKKNRVKIILLNPSARRISEKKDIPDHQHIGLGYLASAIEAAGHDVRVIDAKLERKGIDTVLEDISAFGPDIVGITSMTHEIAIAAQTAESCKKTFPGLITVLGGVHMTALPVETMERYSQFDYGIVGEGEIAFPELISGISAGDHEVSSIAGVVSRGEGGKISVTPSERIEDLDSLRDPSWKYFGNATKYIIISSRGCPYSCVFCMQASGKRVRKRSMERVVREIENVIDTRAPEKFLFYDETFTLDKKRVDDFCDIMISKGLNKKIKWNVTTRVDAVDEDLLRKIKQAGCDHIEFGVESGNEDMLKVLKKGITKEQARKAIRMAKELGFHTEGAFILGHPNETVDTALQTIDFMAELDPDIVQIGIMVPYPGTEIREKALKGEWGYKLLSDDWADYNKQLGNAMELDSLSRSDLEKLQLLGYVKLFISNKRYADFFRFVLRYRMEMLAFLRNIFRKRKKLSKGNIGYKDIVKHIFR